MNARSRLLVVWLLLMMSASTSGTVVRDVRVVGLFTNAAVLEIEGEQALLNAGGAHEGVQLVTASSRSATVRIGKESWTLSLSEEISGRFRTPSK